MWFRLEFVFVPILIYAIYHFLKPRKKYHLPPGPWNIPFVSGIFKVDVYPYLTFQRWSQEYGPLVRTKFGLEDAVIIHDAKLLREAYNQAAFNGKREFKHFTLFSGGIKRGIVNGEGEEWAEQRRFVLRSLRDFGFGKSTMEEFVLEEIHELIKWMKANEGAAIDVHQRLVLATLNFLWNIIAGERHDQDDEQLKHIIEQANHVFNAAGKATGLLVLFPKLTNILPKVFLKGYYELVEKAKPFMQIFHDAIDKHVQNPVDQSAPRDLIDVYLAEVNNNSDPNSSFYRDRGFQMLPTIMNDLYGAGQGTTPHLLTWSILYLSRFPHVQKKLQAELDVVIGRNRTPRLSDKPNLPYTEAVTLEVLRFASLLPLGLLHEATEDAVLGGYDIKKGTVIFPNMYAINYNKETYGDPEVFRPERFLSTDETKVIQFEELTPFSTGKRQCLGETLGKTSLFLFLTSIFQRFEISPDTSRPLPSLDASPGFFREPQKFKVILKDRIN